MTREEQRLYWVWGSMVQRCHNPRSRAYPHYGGRGIHVCERWRRFDAFRTDMGLPAEGLTIERNNPALGYEPSNCRWASRTEQNRNRPTWCRYYTVDGRHLTMREAWERHAIPGVTYRAFVKRLVTRGWTVERALSVPPDPRGGKRVTA